MSHAEKEQLIIQTAKDNSISVFVETGTYQGEMVRAVRSHFRKIYTIEVNRHLISGLRKKFREWVNVNLCYGDSATILPQVMAEIDEPALFWLDAHLGGDKSVPNPIMAELETIYSNRSPGHVVLIDDIREFVRWEHYPNVQEIVDKVNELTSADITIENDIMKIMGIDE